MNRLTCIVVLWLLTATQLMAQPETRISLSNSLTGASRNLPFWMWANHDGMTNPADAWLNLATIGADAAWVLHTEKKSSFVAAPPSLPE